MENKKPKRSLKAQVLQIISKRYFNIDGFCISGQPMYGRDGKIKWVEWKGPKTMIIHFRGKNANKAKK